MTPQFFLFLVGCIIAGFGLGALFTTGSEAVGATLLGVAVTAWIAAFATG